MEGTNLHMFFKIWIPVFTDTLIVYQYRGYDEVSH